MYFFPCAASGTKGANDFTTKFTKNTKNGGVLEPATANGFTAETSFDTA